jgi:tetratricopeptide (TPR) repeat protein
VSSPQAHGDGSISASTISGIASTGAYAQITQVHIPAQGIPAPGGVDAAGVWNVPRRPSQVFVGREAALAELAAALSCASGVVGQSLAGLGGVGKSELAIHHAFATRGRYQYVWWIAADSPANLTAGLAGLARRLCAVTVVLPMEAAASWAVAWLQQHPDWLVVLDNVEDPSDVEEFLAAADGGHVLVTTRRDVDWRAYGLMPVRLGMLTLDQAVWMLIERTGQTDGDAAGRVAESLGRLPLALAQAAAYLNHHRVSMADYAALLAAQPARVFAGIAADAKDERAVSRVWDLTLRALSAADPVAVGVLDVLAWLGPDDIPRDLVTGLLAGDRVAADRVLGLLASHSTITLTADSISMHRLVQAVLRANHPDVTATGLTASAARASRLLKDAVSEDPYRAVDGWPRWRLVMPHVAALAQHVGVGTTDDELGLLLNGACLFALSQGLYVAASTFASQSLAIAEAAFGPNHAAVGVRLGNLATTYGALGRPHEAMPLEERALAIAEAASGRESSDVALALGNLAQTIRVLGRPGDAIPLERRALAITEAQLGRDHPDVAVRLGNLAASCLALGRHGEALPLLQRALAITEAALGPDHLDIASRLGDLAANYADLERLDEAVPLERRALAITEATLGPDHPDVALRLGNLAHSIRTLGRPGEAVPLEQRALAITEAAFGPDHPDVAVRLGHLAASFRSLGRAGDAAPLEERALAITEATLGPDHPTVATWVANLASSYIDLGRVADAVPLQRRALAITEAALGPAHPSVALRLGYLAISCRELGQTAEALALVTRAMRIPPAGLPSDHLTVSSLQRLHDALQQEL